jgi:hypothetical protein
MWHTTQCTTKFGIRCRPGIAADLCFLFSETLGWYFVFFMECKTSSINSTLHWFGVQMVRLVDSACQWRLSLWELNQLGMELPRSWGSVLGAITRSLSLNPRQLILWEFVAGCWNKLCGSSTMLAVAEHSLCELWADAWAEVAVL